MALSVAQAIKRFEAKAEELREGGSYMAAHEYQSSARKLARLMSQAEALPPPKKK